MTRPQPPQRTLPEDTFTLSGGGYVVVALPEALSKSEYEELKDWLGLMQRKAEHKVADQPPSDAAHPAGSSGDDDDSLSWE